MGQDIGPMKVQIMRLAAAVAIVQLMLAGFPTGAGSAAGALGGKSIGQPDWAQFVSHSTRNAAGPAMAATQPASASTRRTETIMKTETELPGLSAYIESSRPEFESRLKELVDIPSVSMDPGHKADIARTAEVAAKALKQMGAQAEVIATEGNPVVFGQLAAGADKPTVLVYNHLDVQPADAPEWKTPPFTLTIEGDSYKGRGTTDDKGPALTVMYAARYAAQQKFPINIKFVWELEEEIGSPSFEAFLEKNRDKLRTDSVVISDTIWVSRDRPAIPYGLRGLQGMLVRLKTGAKDVHSGLTGGLARNPVGELCQVICECYDARTGKVLIPGFYDDVRQPGKEEVDGFIESGFTVDGFLKDHELKSVRTNDARDAAQRIWALPTFEVHGIVGGYSGPGVKTIVPHEAEAKVSMRLVPDQDPDRIADLFTRFVRQRCPDADVIKEGSLRPYVGDCRGPYAQAARQAMVYAFGREPAFIREGGSIGAVVSMSKVLGVPIVFLGLSLPEHGYHAINENYDWGQAAGGMRMFARYFELLSRL